MKKMILVCALVILNGVVSYSASARQDKKKTIAVLSFVNAGGVDENEISILTDRFNNYLVQSGVYDVLEREKIESILKEQDFALSDNCNSSECAVQVGQLLGMEYMVAGKIGKFGQIYTMDARIIDVSTGKIIMTRSENYKGEKEGLLSMIEGLAYALAGKEAPVKASTKTTNGNESGESGKLLSEDGGGMKISAVTRKTGSVEISCEMDGTLYINEKKIGEISYGSVLTIDQIQIGTVRVWVTGFDGEFSGSFKIEENRLTRLTAKPDAVAEIEKSMILIKEGKYRRGDLWGDVFSSDGYHGDDDNLNVIPVHEVTIPEFYLSKFEVKVGWFKLFIDETGYKTDADKNGHGMIANYYNEVSVGSVKKEGINWMHDADGNLLPRKDYHQPVVHVSWNDAKAFCSWLSDKTGKPYRLPYEAEWEYAARSRGKEYKFSWGNGKPSGNVNWKGYDDGFKKSSPVGSFPPNEIGLFDMTGNVDEWCEDWYDENYYKTSPKYLSRGPDKGENRVFRGGSWSDIDNRHLRIYTRKWTYPNEGYFTIGFRVARSY